MEAQLVAENALRQPIDPILTQSEATKEGIGTDFPSTLENLNPTMDLTKCDGMVATNNIIGKDLGVLHQHIGNGNTTELDTCNKHEIVDHSNKSFQHVISKSSKSINQAK